MAAKSPMSQGEDSIGRCIQFRFILKIEIERLSIVEVHRIRHRASSIGIMVIL